MIVQYRTKVGTTLTAIVAVVILAACGVAETGGAPGATPTQALTAPSPTSQATQVALSTVAEPTSTGTVVASQGGAVQDQASLIEALRKAGATAMIGDQVEQPFLSTTGTQVTINGTDVQVFEYADEAAAQADATKLTDTLAGRGTAMISWVASPHAYRAGRVIVLYVGDDPAILKLLQGVLGAPVAEQLRPSNQQPTLSSATPTAASHGAGQVADLSSLVDHLRASGLDVKPAGEVEQPFFEVTGTVLKVNS